MTRPRGLKDAGVIVWDADRVEGGLAAISLARAPLLQYIKELLDEYHRTPRSMEYYDVLLGDWVEQLLHLAYFALSEVAEHPSSPPAAAEPLVTVPTDSFSFTLGAVESPDLMRNLQHIVRRLQQRMDIPGGGLRESPIRRATPGFKSRAKAALANLAAPKNPEILVCAPYFKCSKVEWASAMMRWRRRVRWDDLAYPLEWEAACDEPWRLARAEGYGSSAGILEVAKTLSRLYIPKIFLEGFESYRRQVLSLELSRPKAVYSANALNWHTCFKVLVAEWREEGTQLLYHQHGGGYGIDKQNVLEDYEIRASDRYYTWGWRLPVAKVKPLSPPPPMARRLFGANQKRQILLVCLETPRVPYRLWYQPMPGTMERVVDDTVAFVAKLNRPAELLIRLAPKSFGWKMREAIAVRTPGSRFDDFSRGSLDRFAESAIVVHNYLGTSWLETLAMNIPTICFYSTAIHAFRPEVAPLIMQLEETGILHRSGNAAAGFLRSLGKDAGVWWKSEEVRAVRDAFVAGYANFSSNWAASWEAEFDSLP